MTLRREAITQSTRYALLTAAICLALPGCRESLHHDIDERAANEVVVVLAQTGVIARKEPRAEGRWDVSVPATQHARALEVLASTGLPRREIAVPEAGGSALVPTADQESQRRARALAADLERTLLSMPGVLDVRVHLVLPAPAARFDPQAAAPPRASIVLAHRADLAAPELDAIRAIVQGAVEGIGWDDISVVWSPQTLPTASPSAMTVVGPFAVAAESAGPLRMVLAILSLLLAVAAAAVVRLAMRAPEPS